MAEEKARALGYEPVAFIKSYAVAAVDPGWQLLMGPALAVPKALERAGIPWSELGLLEIHEAFAAQVLSNVQAWGSKAWADRLGLPGPLGEVDWDRANVMGGSIAIGHPFAATGARLVTTLANEMRRRDVQYGLVSICAQGGMGYAMVLSDEAIGLMAVPVRLHLCLGLVGRPHRPRPLTAAGGGNPSSLAGACPERTAFAG